MIVTTSRLRSVLLRRLFRRRTLQLLVIIFTIWNAVEVLQIRRQLARADFADSQAPRNLGRIYVASLHWNNEAILRSHWNNAIIQLSKVLGRENIFISIYESGSWDNTKGALRELDRELEKMGIPRNITVSETTHLEEISGHTTGNGWIDTPRGKKELRRIPYLARLRNLALRPLEDLSREGIVFDKILFANDIVFTV